MSTSKKSSVYFSPNCMPLVRTMIRCVLQISREALSAKYLGLPMALGRLTDRQFDHIVERARSRVQGWCEKKLSYAGKEVLLKSVVQALPAYSMSCFKLTKGLCSKVTAVMSRYWWSGSLDKRGMHWKAWDKLAIPKNRGGPGFRDFQEFNDAMLGKQAWRLLENPSSLCARVLKGRYFPDGDIFSPRRVLAVPPGRGRQSYVAVM